MKKLNINPFDKLRIDAEQGRSIKDQKGFTLISRACKGFTLIELLVVVAIIAILALIVLLAINPVEMARRSRDSRRLSDLGTLRRSIDLSLADNKTLPVPVPPATVWSRTTGAGGSVLVAADAANNLVGVDISKYLSIIPQDPMYKAADTTTIQTTNGTCPSGTSNIQKQNMVYTFKTDGNGYVLSGRLESTENCGIPFGDGGNDAALFQLGTDPGLDL